MLWQKSLGGSIGEDARNFDQTSDGGLILAGYASSNDGDVSGNNGQHDFWIVKLSTDSLLTEGNKTQSIQKLFSIYLILKETLHSNANCAITRFDGKK